MKDVSLHILDIVQNSISAKASKIELTIEENTKKNTYKVAITDNGKGMSEEMARKVTDPFVTSRTTRKVGLGLPLFKQNAELTGGTFNLKSKEGEGTQVVVEFILDNIDRLPAGDLPGSYMLLVTSNPDLDFVFKHITSKGEYIFDTREIKQVLGEIPINDLSVNKYLREMISENLTEIGAEFSKG
jgi:hypothetical protein